MRLLQFILTLLLINSYSCGLNRHDKPMIKSESDSTKTKNVKTCNFQNEILQANKRFQISDKKALQLLLDIKEINILKNWNYKDTITSNDLFLIGIPNDSDQRWQFDLGQFQKGVDKYYALSHFWINASTGKIEVLDMNYGIDNPINLNEWLKLKRKK